MSKSEPITRQTDEPAGKHQADSADPGSVETPPENATLRESDPNSPLTEDPADSPMRAPEDWDPDPKSRRRRLEAVLFLARSPLSSRKLSQLAGLEDGTQARTMVRQLNERYDETGCAFHVKQIAGGYQMLTRPQFSKWLRVMEHIPRRTRLSTPSMETLSIVAYRQPIIKADIEAIRGVNCGEMLRQLLEKGLVRISGRSEELGRPFLYATTQEFLAQFGLGSPDDLPRADELSGQGLPTWTNSDQISSPKEIIPSDATDNSMAD